MFIDELTESIDQRLTQLLEERAQLEAARAQLEPQAAKPLAHVAPAATRRRRAQPRKRGDSSKLTLEALADGEARTAGEIGKITDLPAPTVNNALTVLRKRGDVVKAQRGYKANPTPA